MDKVEMDEMMGLFCVDILVALDIFPTEGVPRYAYYNEEEFDQICFISGALYVRIGLNLYERRNFATIEVYIVFRF